MLVTRLFGQRLLKRNPSALTKLSAQLRPLPVHSMGNAKNKKPRKIIDSRVITVMDKHLFIPSGPAYIRNLPTEIIQQIHSLAIDTSKSSIDQQWNRIYQAIVCREWYKLMKERTKFVFVSVLQMNAMIRMIESEEIDGDGVKEVVFNLSVETADGKVRGFGKIIELCPRIERLTVEFGGNRAKDRIIPGTSDIWTSMEELNLKSLCVLSGINDLDLIRMLPSWPNLRSVDLSLRSEWSHGALPSFTLDYPLESIRLRRPASASFLTSLTSSTTSQIKSLHLGYGDRSSLDWATILQKLMPSLEFLSFESRKLDNKLISLGKNLKSLSIKLSGHFDTQLFESLPYLADLSLIHNARTEEELGDFLTKIVKILPPYPLWPLRLKLQGKTFYGKRINWRNDHPIVSTAASKGIIIMKQVCTVPLAPVLLN